MSVNPSRLPDALPQSQQQLSWKRKLTYSSVIVILLLIAVELIFRSLPLTYYETNQYFQLNRDINFTDVYDKDHELFWRLKRSITTNSELFSALQYRTNSMGFRGAEFPPKTNRPRVLALGNSCTFGWGVVEDSIYSVELQKLVDGIDVLNCGTPGYSSLQGRRLLKRITPELQPDIVLIMFGWNDHWPASHGIKDKEQHFPPQWALNIQNRLSGLATYKALRQLSLRLTGSKSNGARMDRLSGAHRVPLTDFKDNLRSIISYCREHNITPVLLSPPVASLANYFPGKTVSAFHDLHRSYQRAIAAVGASEGAPVIDLQSAFDTRADLFDNAENDAIHFNAAGHRIVAEQIAPVLDSLLHR